MELGDHLWDLECQMHVLYEKYKISENIVFSKSKNIFSPGKKIFFDMKKKTFFQKSFIFHKASALRIPNPKGGLLTPKTQKVTTENVKKIALFYHKARLARTDENSEITLR